MYLYVSTSSKSVCAVVSKWCHVDCQIFPLVADLGDTSSVLREFDTVLSDKAVPENLPGLVDAASLLWRLNVIGVDPGEKRWEKVIDGHTKYTGHHS